MVLLLPSKTISMAAIPKNYGVTWMISHERTTADRTSMHGSSTSRCAMEACYPDPSPVVDAMVDAVASRHPKHRYLVGDLIMTYSEAYWFNMLPSWLSDRTFHDVADSVAVPAALRKTKVQ